MKNLLLALVLVIILAAAAWFAWILWGPQLSHLPGQLSAIIHRLLTGLVGSLAGFGEAVRNSFRMPGR